ncbi:MAG: DMT family transporter [Erysipelotrichales bacterium]|nr:MAG: DMT family transporter [Erysipelotrichales bacterium]
MLRDRKEELSLLFALAGFVIFGFSFIFTKQALSVSSLFVMLAARFSLAFIILNLLILTGKFKINLKKGNLGLLLLLGVVQPIIYFICESYGIKLSATSFVGTILALIPMVSLVFGVVLLKEKVKALQVFCTLASVFGVILTAMGQASGTFSWAGFALLIGAVFSASLFNIISRKISVDFSAFERTYVMFALGSVTFVLIALIQNGNNLQEMIIAPLTDFDFIVPIIFLAGLSSVGAFLMINYAMTYLDVARIAIFGNITTVISILVGVIILKESFGLYQLLGSIIIITSVYVVNRPALSRKIKMRKNESIK